MMEEHDHINEEQQEQLPSEEKALETVANDEQTEVAEVPQTEESIENAIWGMKFDFWHHWSSHAVDAIRTIHYVIEKTEKYK